MTELTVAPNTRIMEGMSALKELTKIVKTRPDKLVINNRQYLYFSDWQTLGAFFNVTALVTSTEEICEEIPSESVAGITFKKPIGFLAKASAIQNGEAISAAEAECCFDEPNWKAKPRFQLRSMAQTRACAKALRNCLSWVVRLPQSNFTDEVAEETLPNGLT